MPMTNNKIIVAISGASGSIYAKLLLDKLITLQNQFDELSIVLSNNAKDIWEYEIGNSDFKKYPFSFYENNDFNSPIASGSSKHNTMIVCPCSMGSLGRIANGTSDDLISRSADVILKERKKLILVTRENPLSLIHINNMKTVTLAGGIICPANPSFYSKPTNINELVGTVVDKILHLAGFQFDSYSWNGCD